MTAGHQKNFSAGRERIVAALGKDGESASSRADTKVSSELNAKVTAAHGKIEAKALQEKSNLERQANGKDGQARLEATRNGAKQRSPIQRWAWLDSVFEWFGQQWDKVKSTFTSPSFWAGLIVGLVVAIAIVAAVAAIIATGGAAAGVLLALGPLLLPVIGGVAGAAAGFAGTVASNVTHNAVGEKNADGSFTQRGVFEGAGRNTLLGLGAGVALAYAPASLPWLIGGGAALNVGIGAYDNVQNDKPWYDSLGADAVIGGVTALIGFGALKGFARVSSGTRFSPENIPTNAAERANVQKTTQRTQRLQSDFAAELQANSNLAQRLNEIRRNPNASDNVQRLADLEVELSNLRQNNQTSSIQDIHNLIGKGFRSSAQLRQQFADEFVARYGRARYDSYVRQLTAMKARYPELQNIPMEDLIALKGYTSSDYSALNPALRGQSPTNLADLNAYIKCAVSALDQMPPHVGEVFRGTDLTPGLAARYNVGDVVTEQAFMSSSAASGAEFSGNTKFTIESSNGRRVQSISDFPHEIEVLFAPGTRFRVVKNEVVGGVRQIELVETR